jgi:hypothetical protein
MPVGQADEIIDPEAALVTGAQGDSTPADLNYYQRKVLEFQQTVNAVDQAAYGLRMVLDLDISDDARLPVLALLSDFEMKKSELRTAGESINAASALANTIGIKLPQVNLQTLGALPLVPIGVGAAIAGALFLIGSLVSWMVNWIDEANEAIELLSKLEGLTPEQKTTVFVAREQTNQAKAQHQTGLGSIANIVQWVALAGVAFFAYQAFVKYQDRA